MEAVPRELRVDNVTPNARAFSSPTRELRDNARSTKMALDLQSTVRLRSGRDMPVLGFGVFENDTCAPACKTALEVGYRYVIDLLRIGIV